MWAQNSGFGLDKILAGIKEHFSSDIDRIKKIEKKFEENIINQEIKTSESNPALNIMSSLEQSNSFGQYLEKILRNICDEYFNAIPKIINYNDDLENKNKKFNNILQTLKNHLKFEYDVESFKSLIDNKNEIDCSTESIKSGCLPFNNNNDKNKDEPIRIFKKKIEDIKQIVIDNSKNDIININEYMKGVIQSYEDAIKSLEAISNDINQN